MSAAGGGRPVRETAVAFGGGWLYVRHTVDTDEGARPALLFVHGLGCSGLCFSEAFEAPSLAGFDLIAADLAGFGRSSAAADYSMASQISRLWLAVESLGVDRFALVGHSMGGDVGTWMAHAHGAAGRIAGLCNIEGNLTPADTFISGRAVRAADEGRFDTWLRTEVLDELAFGEVGRRWPSARRCQGSLYFARPEAFLHSAREMCRRNTAAPGSTLTLTGTAYAGLPIPTLFCWGEESLSAGTRSALERERLENRAFAGAYHWPMADKPGDFYPLLAERAAAWLGVDITA